MRQFFQSRRFRYQIVALIEDKWEIVEIVGDGRDSLLAKFEKHDYEALEQDVERRARLALARPGTKTVKVLRERIMDESHVLESEILKLDAPPVAPGERLVGNYNGDHPLCQSAEDLLFRPALRSIGLLLRPFLDRFDITAIELITLKATNRRLQNADRAINEAVTASARQQAAALGISSKERTAQLDGFVRQSFQRLRDAERLADPPKLQAGKLLDFQAAVEAAIPLDDRRFWIFRGLSHYITDSRHGVTKLELLLALMPDSIDAALMDQIDEIIACIVDQSETIKQLLGSQPDLKTAMFALVALIGGTAPNVAGAAEVAPALSVLLRRNLLPKTGHALWDRILRTLEGNQNMAGARGGGEWAALDQLRAELIPVLPEAMTEPAGKALDRRAAQARQQLLGRG